MIKLIIPKYSSSLDSAIWGGRLLCPILVYRSEAYSQIQELNISIDIPKSDVTFIKPERKQFFYIVPIFDTFVGYPSLEATYIDALKQRVSRFYPKSLVSDAVEISPLCLCNNMISINANHGMIFTDIRSFPQQPLLSSPV